MLYCAGDEITKLALLHDIIIGSCKKKPSKPSDENLISKIEAFITIPTLLIANIIDQKYKFSSKVEEEKLLIEELERISKLLIESTTNSHLREFAGNISREFFFDKNTYELLDKRGFLDKCK